MTELRTLAPRPLVAAVLVLVLFLAGVGQGWATASDGPEVAPSIAGITVHICHADANGSADPGSTPHHDCCDACALCAPVTLPPGPDLNAPAGVVRYITHAAALPWAPIAARDRTPRLAQGPPAA